MTRWFLALPLLAAVLVAVCACSAMDPERQARLDKAPAVACVVDGVVVPAAQPVVASVGAAGTAIANADMRLHPAVVAACKAIGGKPADAAPMPRPGVVG